MGSTPHEMFDRKTEKKDKRDAIHVPELSSHVLLDTSARRHISDHKHRQLVGRGTEVVEHPLLRVRHVDVEHLAPELLRRLWVSCRRHHRIGKVIIRVQTSQSRRTPEPSCDEDAKDDHFTTT